MQGHSIGPERTRSGKPTQMAQASAQHPLPRRLVLDRHDAQRHKWALKSITAWGPVLFNIFINDMEKFLS